MVVVGRTGQRRFVVDLSAEAASAGVRHGMTLAEAKAFSPLTILEHDPVADRRAIEALGRWLTRFTPTVAVGWAEEDDTEATEQPATLFLDVTGSERLFGGMSRLAQQVQTALRKFRIPAAVAVAPTPGAAWALTWAPDMTDARVVRSEELEEAIAPLRVTALRLDAECVASLHQLGLCTIGQLLALPRNQLPSRFGRILLTRLDQATGQLPEVLTPLSYEVPVMASMAFDAPVSAIEAVRAVVGQLVRRVCDDLARRGHGAKRIKLTCAPDHAARRKPTEKVVDLTRPSRDPSVLLKLFDIVIEHVGDDEGFTSIRLDVPLHESIGDDQSILLGDGERETETIQVDRLMERLRVRLGDDAVFQTQLVESYLPEHAWRPTNVLSATTAAPVTLERMTRRPPHLLSTPVEIQVTAEPSDDARIGSPRQFTHEGRVHRLMIVIGPERLSGEWWRGHHRTRDYYEVEDETGLRFWLFRVVRIIQSTQGDVRPSARWFLHGRFA